ncbi:MAG: hypothetical protein ACKVHL_09575 [Rhodospirillales bacterium]|jgi:hypothetical protein
MRNRNLFLIFVGFNCIVIAAALAFSVYVSGAQWMVDQPGGIQQHDEGKKQLRLRRGLRTNAAE